MGFSEIKNHKDNKFVKNKNEIKKHFNFFSQLSLPTKFSIALWCAISLVAVAVIYMLYVRSAEILGVGDNKIKNIPIVYTSFGKLMYKNQLMNSPDIVDADLNWGIASNLKNSALLNEDGKYLLYLNNTDSSGGSLYLKYTAGTGFSFDNDKFSGLKVADNVVHASFKFLSGKKRIVYLSTDGILNIWENNSTKIIDSGVKKLVSVDSADNIYYIIGNDENILKVAKNSSSGGINTISNRFKSIYDIDSTGGIRYIFTTTNGVQSLAYYNQTGNEILAEDCETILEMSKDNSIFFIRSQRNIFDTSLLFTDKYKFLDQDLKEPTVSEYTKEQAGLFGEISLVFDEAAYNKATEEYKQKLKRDSIRQGLSRDVRVIDAKSLVFRSGETEVIVENSISSVLGVNAEFGLAAYEKYAFSPQKRYDISEIDSVEAGYEIVTTELAIKENYQDIANMWEVNSKSNEIDNGKYLERVYFSKNGDIYTIDANMQLNYKAIQDNNFKRLVDGVNYFNVHNAGNIGIKMSSSEHELFSILNGDYTKLYSCDSPLVINGTYKDFLLLYSNYNETISTGNLLLYTNDVKINNISDNVYSYSVRAKDMIYILKNFSNVSGGELYVYIDGNLQKLDDGVEDILTSKEWGFGR